MTSTAQTIILAVLGLAIVLLVVRNMQKAKKTAEKNTLFIPPGWWLFRKVLMSNRPEVLPDGSLRIQVPVGPNGDLISHVLNGTPRTLTAGMSMVTSGTVTGGPIVADGTNQAPTFCHFMSRKNADLNNPNHRWYSQNTVALKEGDFVLTSTLTADAWINRDGQKNEAEFNATLNDLGAVGGVCGAEIGRAHGVYALAPTTIEITLETVG